LKLPNPHSALDGAFHRSFWLCAFRLSAFKFLHRWKMNTIKIRECQPLFRGNRLSSSGPALSACLKTTSGPAAGDVGGGQGAVAARSARAQHPLLGEAVAARSARVRAVEAPQSANCPPSAVCRYGGRAICSLQLGGSEPPPVAAHSARWRIRSILAPRPKSSWAQRRPSHSCS
jgi:hypothetical protein